MCPPTFDRSPRSCRRWTAAAPIGVRCPRPLIDTVHFFGNFQDAAIGTLNRLSSFLMDIVEIDHFDLDIVEIGKTILHDPAANNDNYLDCHYRPLSEPDSAFSPG